MKDIGLFNGMSGILTLITFLNKKVLPDDTNKQERKIEFLIDKIIEGIDRMNISLRFSDGIPGIIWAFNYIAKNKLYDLDIEDFMADIDSGLFTILKKNVQRLDADSVLGLGMYYRMRQDIIDTESKAYIKEFLWIEMHKILKIKTHSKYLPHTSDDIYLICLIAFMARMSQDPVLSDALTEYCKVFIENNNNLFYEDIINSLIGKNEYISIENRVDDMDKLSTVELMDICLKYSACNLLFGISLENRIVANLRTRILEIINHNPSYEEALISFDECKYGLNGLAGLGIFLSKQ